MSLEPMDPGSFPMFPLYISMTIVFVVLTIVMFRRWQAKKTTPPKLLLLTFGSIVFCLVTVTIGFEEVVRTGFKMDVYKVSLAIGYAGLMVSNIFVVLFARDVFFMKWRSVILQIIASVAIAIIVALPTNYYGVPNAETPDDSIRTYSSIAMVLYFALAYFLFAIKAFSVSRHSIDPVGKAGFKYIAYSFVCFMLFAVFFLIDAILQKYAGFTGYTVFIYMAWVLIGIFAVLSYLGLVMPI